MWSRIGVKTEVDAAAPPVFFKNRDCFEYSAYMAGWGASTGELNNALKALLRPPTARRAWARPIRPLLEQGDGRQARGGAGHRRRAKREALLARPANCDQQDHGLIPIHFELSVWAMKKGLTYQGRADQNTLAVGVKPAK